MKEMTIFFCFALFLLMPLTWQREKKALAHQSFLMTQANNNESQKIINLVWRLPEVKRQKSEGYQMAK